MDVPVVGHGVYVFGPFRLDPVRRSLLRDSNRVTLTARLFDTLLYLVQHHDRLVERHELESAVWRGRTVEEGNLGKAVSSLRKALQVDAAEASFIVTAPGRGYRFAMPVVFEPVTPAVEPPDWLVAAPAGVAGLAQISHALDASGPLPVSAANAVARSRRWLGFAAAAALAIAVAAGLRPLWRDRETSTADAFAPPPLSVVVMPFQTPARDPRTGILADNVTDDLTDDLRHLPGSVVKARESALGLAGRPVGEIGRALNVRYILEGRLWNADGKLDVSAELIDAVTGSSIWHNHFDSAMGVLWETQADIVHDIASALNVTLVDQEVARAARERPNNQNALDLFYLGRSKMDRADSLDQLSEAQQYLERAVAQEPDFVEALAALGWLLVQKFQGFSDPRSGLDRKEADQVTMRALTIDKANPTALAARSRVLASTGRCTDAQATAEAALEPDPNNVAALFALGSCAWHEGHPEKVQPYVAAILRIDPRGPTANRTYRLGGLAALFSGQASQAVDMLLRGEAREVDTKDLDKFSPVEVARLYLIAAYALAGDLPEAQRRCQDFQATWRHRSVWREMSFFNRQQEAVPGATKVQAALEAAGLQMFSDEHEDDGVAPTPTPLTGSDFTPTPRALPGGGKVIDTAAFLSLLAQRPAPVVVEVGKFREVLDGAIRLSDEEAAYGQAAMDAAPFAPALRRGLRDGIVVMGTGVAGIQGYNAALHFISLHYPRVYWYRGGEEAWAAHGLPAKDMRAR